MPDRLTTSGDYTPDALALVRSACLTVATVLGDLMEEDITIVGGLVPSLLIDPRQLPEGAEPHPGTTDLDLGLQLTVLEDEHYKEISERLHQSGFEPDRNKDGKITPQRWYATDPSGVKITIDFLIAPDEEWDGRRRTKYLEAGFAAYVIPGIDLAARDREIRRVQGVTLRGYEVTRDLWVCGPGAFIVLKALASRKRDTNKDSFDLYYVVRNYGESTRDVATRLRDLLDSPLAQEALQILREDFSGSGGIGARRVEAFLGREDDTALRADVVGFVDDLIRQCAADSPP